VEIINEQSKFCKNFKMLYALTILILLIYKKKLNYDKFIEQT